MLTHDIARDQQRNMISSSSYATKWYITLFANSVPFQVQLRIWDAFFLEGLDALVLAAVGIIWSFRTTLGAINTDFETILSALSSFYITEDEDMYLRWIRKMLNQGDMRERMGRWRRDWQTLVSRKEADKALL